MAWSTLFLKSITARKERNRCRSHGTKVVGVGNEEVFLAFSDELIQHTAMQQSGVKVWGRSETVLPSNSAGRVTSVTGRVPLVLIVRGRRGCGKKSFLQDTRVTRLIEGGDAELLICILLDDAQGVIVCVERGHEDERNVDMVGGVEVLNLAHGQIQERHVVLHFEGGFGSGHA